MSREVGVLPLSSIKQLGEQGYNFTLRSDRVTHRASRVLGDPDSSSKLTTTWIK